MFESVNPDCLTAVCPDKNLDVVTLSSRETPFEVVFSCLLLTRRCRAFANDEWQGESPKISRSTLGRAYMHNSFQFVDFDRGKLCH